MHSPKHEKDWEKNLFSVFLPSSPIAQSSLYFSGVPVEVNVNGFEGGTKLQFEKRKHNTEMLLTQPVLRDQ